MPASLHDLRTGVARTLQDALPGWNVYQLPPDNIDPPAIAIGGFNVDTGTFGDGSLRVAAEVQFMVSRRHVDQVEVLDELLSPSGTQSIWQIFGDDPTLDGLVGFCSVQQAGDYRELVVAEIGYYAASATLSVML